ncbi:hypothetical protein KGY73_10400 [bacterium]|nr:hypothetical protein [bacterium]
MEKIHIMKFSLHSYEVDFRGKAHLHSLLNYLQEAAVQQAALMGFGFEDLIQKKLIWLLSRYHIQVSRYPRLGETVEVATWPSGIQGTFALRDFTIKDQKGTQLLAATSSWILWNIENKHPSPLQNYFTEDLIHPKRSLEDPFDPLPQLKKTDHEVSFRVLKKDLDLNRHVNNTVYIQWALESVPKDILLEKSPLEVEAAYKSEAFCGETIQSRVQRKNREGNPGYLHQIVNPTKESELTRLRTLWG